LVGELYRRRRLDSGDPTLAGPVRALAADERIDLLAKIDADERAVSRDLPDLFRFLMGRAAGSVRRWLCAGLM
jgi:hypothetical protein